MHNFKVGDYVTLEFPYEGNGYGSYSNMEHIFWFKKDAIYKIVNIDGDITLDIAFGVWGSSWLKKYDKKAIDFKQQLEKILNEHTPIT